MLFPIFWCLYHHIMTISIHYDPSTIAVLHVNCIVYLFPTPTISYCDCTSLSHCTPTPITLSSECFPAVTYPTLCCLFHWSCSFSPHSYPSSLYSYFCPFSANSWPFHWLSWSCLFSPYLSPQLLTSSCSPVLTSLSTHPSLCSTSSASWCPSSSPSWSPETSSCLPWSFCSTLPSGIWNSLSTVLVSISFSFAASLVFIGLSAILPFSLAPSAMSTGCLFSGWVLGFFRRQVFRFAVWSWVVFPFPDLLFSCGVIPSFWRWVGTPCWFVLRWAFVVRVPVSWWFHWHPWVCPNFFSLTFGSRLPPRCTLHHWKLIWFRYFLPHVIINCGYYCWYGYWWCYFNTIWWC